MELEKSYRVGAQKRNELIEVIFERVKFQSTWLKAYKTYLSSKGWVNVLEGKVKILGCNV